LLNVASPDDLPHDQSQGVDVNLFEGLNVLETDPGIQYLGSHVSVGTHLEPRTGGNKGWIGITNNVVDGTSKE
jgi:hypothetical protein